MPKSKIVHFFISNKIKTSEIGLHDFRMYINNFIMYYNNLCFVYNMITHIIAVHMRYVNMSILNTLFTDVTRGEGGTKRDLISIAKRIVEASEEVTRLAKLLAKDCTDKRMRTVCIQAIDRTSNCSILFTCSIGQHCFHR